VAEQIVGLPVDDLVPRQEQEIARLEMLVEAAGRSRHPRPGTRWLADVLRVAQSTLDADAYALWRRVPREEVWSLFASSGLSDDYVARAPAAVAGHESVSVEGTAHRDRHRVDGLAHARAQGGARRRGARGDAGDAAAPPRRGRRHARLLLAPSAAASATSRSRAASANAQPRAAAIGTAAVYEEQARLAETAA
jgi:hypothetical protein